MHGFIPHILAFLFFFYFFYSSIYCHSTERSMLTLADRNLHPVSFFLLIRLVHALATNYSQLSPRRYGPVTSHAFAAPSTLSPSLTTSSYNLTYHLGPIFAVTGTFSHFAHHCASSYFVRFRASHAICHQVIPA